MSIRDDKQLLYNQSGISLVEVLLGITLLLLIMAPIVNSLTAGITSYQYNMAQSNNITSTRELINSLTNELRYSTAVTISASGKTIDYIVENQNRKIYIGTGNDAHTLIIEYNGVINKKVAANKIQDITFQRDTNKINITLQFNDNSYTNSPTLNITNITIALQNM